MNQNSGVTSLNSMLYLLSKSKSSLTKHKIFKLLYFADLYHMENYGSPFIDDEFIAMPFGPVPSITYKHIQDAENLSFLRGSDFYVKVSGKEVSANAEPNFDELSPAIIEALDYSYDNYINKNFGYLSDKSHDAAWQAAFNSTNNRKVINPVEMAKANISNVDTLNYIQDFIEFRSFVSK